MASAQEVSDALTDAIVALAKDAVETRAGAAASANLAQAAASLAAAVKDLNIGVSG